MIDVNPQISSTENGASIIALEEHGYYLEIKRDYSGWHIKINDWNTPKRTNVTPWKILSDYNKIETSRTAKSIRDALKEIYGVGYPYGLNKILDIFQTYEYKWEIPEDAKRPSPSEKPSKIDKIIETVMAQDIKLFCDQHSRPFIQIPIEVNDGDDSDDSVPITNKTGETLTYDICSNIPKIHSKTPSLPSSLSQNELNYINKTYPLNSQFVKRWIASLIWEKYDFGPSDGDIKSARLSLGGIAQSKENIDLFNRVAEDSEDNWWLDLTNDKWEAIKITDEDWSIEIPPVLFKRLSHHKPLFTPIRNGDASLLLDYIRLDSVNSQLLWLVTQISYIIPDFPHPISVLWGGKGTIKTTAQRLVKMLIDKSSVGLLSMPSKHKPNELIQQLDHHYIAGYDNISNIDETQSDILSRAITNLGQSKRVLFSDDEDFTTSFIRCITMNGISIRLGKPDLFDRAILHETIATPKSARKKIKVVMADFESQAPSILGGFLDILVKARNISNELNVDSLNRMADFTFWGCAITKALGIDPEKFEIAYNENIKMQEQETIRSSQIGDILIGYLEWKIVDANTDFKITPTKFYHQLKNYADSQDYSVKSGDFPVDSGNLTKALNEIASNLPSMGFSRRTKRTGDTRYIFFSKLKATKLTDITEVSEKQTTNVWMVDDLRDILRDKKTKDISEPDIKETEEILETEVEPIISEPKIQTQLKKVLEVISELERGSGVAKDDDVYEILMEEYGIVRSDGARFIGVLMRDGTIYSPRPGYYKRTN